MTTIAELPVILLSGLAAGLMIGCVGIGGVILAPILSYVVGVDVHQAIAAAMLAFLMSGVAGMAVFVRRGSLRWDMALMLWAGAMPTALAGALAAGRLPSALLEMGLGLLTAFAGLHALKQRDPPGAAPDKQPARTALIAAGGVTGFLSALSGTGGPLVLIPILLWRRVAVLTAIGLGQAIQLPIGLLATGGYLYAGLLDPAMGLVLGTGVAIGTLAGGRLAHRLPRAALQRIVAVLLILVGATMLARLAYRFLLS